SPRARRPPQAPWVYLLSPTQPGSVPSTEALSGRWDRRLHKPSNLARFGAPHSARIASLLICSGCKEPPPDGLPGAPRVSFSLVLLGAQGALPGPRTCRPASPSGSPPPPSGPPLLIPAFPSFPLRRRCGCRGNAARRLLDYLQSQLPCPPPQRLDLLLLH